MALTILYIVLSVCIGVVTGFAAYALYQMGLAMKETRKTANTANKQLEKIDDAVTKATTAANSVSSLVQKATETLEQPMEGVMKGINIAQKIIEKFREGGRNHDDEYSEDEEA